MKFPMNFKSIMEEKNYTIKKMQRNVECLLLCIGKYYFTLTEGREIDIFRIMREKKLHAIILYNDITIC